MGARPCGKGKERWVGTWILGRVRTEPASASFMLRTASSACNGYASLHARLRSLAGQLRGVVFCCISRRYWHLIGAEQGLVYPLPAEFYGIGGVPVALDRTARGETFITSWVA